ncbi:hypothetical protein [Streptomyces sp. NPDC048340]|uniref:hypothetical protein n=1 Tax=Streptomyces sp. NPDC048340 TaxID=3365537 RepID=UPI00371E69F5
MNAPSYGPPRGRVRPHVAWYALPAASLLAALAFAGLGVVAGLFLTAGKRYACDATTACTKTPYEAGYHDPAWPHWPFVTAAVCAAVAVAAFAAILLARRRARRAALPAPVPSWAAAPQGPGAGWTV